ncbi:MAG: hypothetical protein NVS4B11_10180 [Ktedonobacteraceae bacterium]
MLQQQPQGNGNQQGMLRRQYLAQQQTLPQPTAFPPQGPVFPSNGLPMMQPPMPTVPLAVPTAPPKKKRVSRIIAVLLIIGLAGAIYFIWQTSSPTTTTSNSSVSQQNFSTSGTAVSTSGEIRAYIVGAVKHPGIYTLTSDARVYDLLQAAGGTLPQANLVAINLAAKISDGQEVYVTMVGEAPPTYMGGVPGTGSGNTNSQLVNINTASVDELSQRLHISKTSAQAIVDYRTQHGNFTSVDQLAQVVSRSIYTKIKTQCTV